MNLDILTKQDLEDFRKNLLQDLTDFFSKQGIEPEKEYLRTRDVKKLLNVSNGTLQNWRVNSLLTPTKIQGAYYYKLSEIKALLSADTEQK